jgi:opacity protein-like surface antigen
VRRILLTVLSVAIWACMAATASAQVQAPIRVRCGGPQYTDTKGQVWQADNGYNTGTISTTGQPITGTSDPKLFQRGRYNADAKNPLTYTFAVAGGTYHVNLLFAEYVFQKPGQRVFNVRMQGQVVLQNLDLLASAGFDKALTRGVDVTVTNGELTIEFDNVVQNPIVSAIEIIQTSVAPEMRISFVYPDGTPVSGTLTYKISTAETVIGGNEVLNNGQATCYLFTSPAVLGLIGEFQASMSLTDSAENPLWQMNLSLDPATVNLGAVQASSMVVVVQKPS